MPKVNEESRRSSGLPGDTPATLETAAWLQGVFGPTQTRLHKKTILTFPRKSIFYCSWLLIKPTVDFVSRGCTNISPITLFCYGDRWPSTSCISFPLTFHVKPFPACSLDSTGPCLGMDTVFYTGIAQSLLIQTSLDLSLNVAIFIPPHPPLSVFFSSPTSDQTALGLGW